MIDLCQIYMSIISGADCLTRVIIKLKRVKTQAEAFDKEFFVVRVRNVKFARNLKFATYTT